jgi:hypothetical protein
MSDPTHKTTAVVRQEHTQAMHPMVQMAMGHGGQIDPDTLRKLMDMQREWEAGESKRAFTRALVQMKNSLPASIGKDATVDFTSTKGRTYFKHTSLAGMMDAVTPILAAHGFSVSWIPQTNNSGITVTCRLSHSDGHSEETTIAAPPDQSGGKNAVQAVASTITYLQRYTAMSILGLASGDMTEPHGQGGDAPWSSAPTSNTNSNIKAVAALKKYGKTKEQAEAHLKKKAESWTREDLKSLKAWLEVGHDEPPHNPETGEVDHSYGPPPMEMDANE